MKTYERKSYEQFQNLSKQISDFNKSIDTPEKYGNNVFYHLKNMGISNAKQLCLENSNLIFNAFLMGEERPADIARQLIN